MVSAESVIAAIKGVVPLISFVLEIRAAKQRLKRLVTYM